MRLPVSRPRIGFAARRALLTAALAAVAAAAAAEVSVRLTEPPAGLPVFGRVEIAAEVEADEPVERVLFFIDGSLVGQREEPPWRVAADVGHQNADHEFRAVVFGVSGARGTDLLTTAAIAVDDAIDLELQQLYVTVTGGGGRVLGLERDDFRVFDDGVEQEVVTFERGEVPITAVLLLDVSESMIQGRLEAALGGARAFVGGMQELDEAKVVLFSDRVRRAVPFTGDEERLLSALEGIEPAGGTAVNDHLFLALELLAGRQGRRVVVLFSDGVDVHSVLPMEEVLETARTSPALIYWIHLTTAGSGDDVPSVSSAWRDRAANERQVGMLRRAVEASGGRVEILDRPEQIGPAFAEIMAELREQYVLGYYPSRSRDDGSWHEVDVKVKGLGLRARSRGGYFDR